MMVDAMVVRESESAFAEDLKEVVYLVDPALVLDSDRIESSAPCVPNESQEQPKVLNVDVLETGDVLARSERDALEFEALLTKITLWLHDAADQAVFDKREARIVSEADSEDVHEDMPTVPRSWEPLMIIHAERAAIAVELR
jgi:hypothetical protein